MMFTVINGMGRMYVRVLERNIVIDIPVAREIWVLRDDELPIKNTVVCVPLLSVCVWAMYYLTFHHFERFWFLVL